MGGKNHRIFPPEEIAGFEQQAGPQGGGSEHDAWVVMGIDRKVVIWTVQPYLEGTHPTQAELVADLASQGWRPAGSLHNHLFFEHTPSGVRMHDVHAGNFIRQKSGNLIPIDVFFEGLPAPPS